MNNIKKIIRESFSDMDEERISNTDAAQKVNDRKNFVGSHVFGEDIGAHVGKPNEMYVVFSYGEQHPLYVWTKDEKGNGVWYCNSDDYYLKNGRINVWTKKHLKVLKPKGQIIIRSESYIKQMIKDYKTKNNILKNSHKNLEPGEK